MYQMRFRKPKRLRIGWMVTALALLTVASAAGYFVYQQQKVRNTQRLLQDARRAQQAGDFDHAIESYGLYLNRTNADIDALRAYASLLHDRLSTSRKWLRPTISALRHLNRADPHDAQSSDRLVRLYMDLREFGLAQELAKSWVELDPNEPVAVLALARAGHGNNNSDFALKVLAEAATRNPREPRYYPLLVELLSNVFQRHEEALDWVQRGLANDPLAHEVHMAAFLYFNYRRQFETAQQHLEQALELAPDVPEVLISGARFFTSRGQQDRAGALLDRAVQSQPGAPGLLAARRDLAVHANDPDLLISVADDLQRASESGDPMLLAHAAELYLRARAIPQADGCIKALDSQAPALLPKGTLDSLRGARALIADRPYAAIGFLESAVREQPSDLWTLEMLARALLRTGTFDEPADLYRRLILQAPSAAAPRLALSRLEIQDRNFDRAREMLASIKSASAAEVKQVKILTLVVDLNQPDNKTREQATQDLEAIAENLPSDVATLETVTHAFLDAGLPDRSLDIWRKSTVDSAARNRIALDIGRRLISEDDIDSAKRWRQALLEPDLLSIEARVLHCEILLTQGAFDEARRFVENTSAHAIDRGLLWETLAEKSPDPATRLEAMTRAAQLRPSEIAVRQKLARLLEDLPAAQRIVDEMRAIEGENGIQWRFERASTLLRLDGSTQAASTALNLLRDCVDVRPGWVAARGLMGYAHEILASLPEAVEAYRAALALDPDLATHTVALRLIEALKKLGRYAEADAALAPIARSMPDSIDVQRLLTEQYIRRMDLGSAAAVAEQILKASPNDPSWAALTADLQRRTGDSTGAEQTAREAILRHPDSATLIASLARALLAQQKNDEAEQLARKFVAQKKNAPFDMILARVLVELGRPREAGKVLDDALLREPNNASLFAAAAEFWGTQGDRPRQLELTRKTLELREDDPNESLWLAAVLASGSPQEREDAASIARRRIAAYPDDADAWLLEAQLALTEASPDAERALTALIAALKINPRSLQAHKMLAAVSVQRGEINAAHEAIAAGLIAAPDDPDLLMLLAEVRQHRGEYELSMTPLRKLVSGDSPPLRTFDLFATAAMETHQIDQAIHLIESLPEIPNDVSIVLARLLESRGDAEKANDLLRKVAEQAPSVGMTANLLFQARRGAFDQVEAIAIMHAANQPEDIETQMTAAGLIAAQSSDSKARRRGLEWLDRIAANHPDFAADARFRAGLVHLQQGDLVNAETMLLSALQLAPLNARPINALAWLYGEELGDPQRGLAMLTGYESSGGRLSPEMLDTYGTLLFRAKRFDEAIRKFNECLRVSGQSAVRTAALYHLALLQFETGATQDAAINLRTSLQLNERVGGLTLRQLQESRHLLTAGASGR